jgi:hypothetical protein
VGVRKPNVFSEPRLTFLLTLNHHIARPHDAQRTQRRHSLARTKTGLGGPGEQTARAAGGANARPAAGALSEPRQQRAPPRNGPVAPPAAHSQTRQPARPAPSAASSTASAARDCMAPARSSTHELVCKPNPEPCTHPARAAAAAAAHSRRHEPGRTPDQEWCICAVSPAAALPHASSATRTQPGAVQPRCHNASEGHRDTRHMVTRPAGGRRERQYEQGGAIGDEGGCAS